MFRVIMSSFIALNYAMKLQEGSCKKNISNFSFAILCFSNFYYEKCVFNIHSCCLNKSIVISAIVTIDLNFKK